MTAGASAMLSERRMVAAGLRAWADELDQEGQSLPGVAVELAVRAYAGEFADAAWPWVREAGALGLFWLDVDAMAAWDGGRPAHPIMCLVEALAGGRPARRLSELLGRLDATTGRLVLCAFDHAAAGVGREVALYAFGGDPHHLAPRPVEPLPWPVDELDRYDRPAVAVDPRPRMRPRLKVAGGAR